jgi:hypothetical protein
MSDRLPPEIWDMSKEYPPPFKPDQRSLTEFFTDWFEECRTAQDRDVLWVETLPGIMHPVRWFVKFVDPMAKPIPSEDIIHGPNGEISIRMRCDDVRLP